MIEIGAAASSESMPVPRSPVIVETLPARYGPSESPTSVVPMKKAAVAVPRIRGSTRSTIVAAAAPSAELVSAAIGIWIA